MKIKRKLTVDIELTPEDLADCFCDLYDNEQAFFFNRIAEVVATWGKPFCFQLQYISNNKALTSDGKEIMSMIGEYSEVIK